ncbi:TMEM165/GDT1 family protein [Sphingomonas sp. DT-204]|uniref:TMEM165/GDT1 family protein n=1 Tax=Sphingomonas sp. DT-204 TaxID=3396166 RepID=UPI003F1C8D23
MDTLLPALVAALLAGIGDRPAWLAARIGRKYRPSLGLAAVVLAHALAAAVAVAGGWLVAPLLTPNAKALLLALALIFAGAGAMLRAPSTRERDCIRGPVTTLAGLASAAASDRATLIAFALAARGPQPELAGVGMTLAAAALGWAAISLGTEGWRALPLRPLSIAGGTVLLLAGIVVGLGGLRLI